MFHDLGVDIRVLPSRSGDDHELILEEPAATEIPAIEPVAVLANEVESIVEPTPEPVEDHPEVVNEPIVLEEDDYEDEDDDFEESEPLAVEAEDEDDEDDEDVEEEYEEDFEEPLAEHAEGSPFELWWDQPIRYDDEKSRIVFDDGELVEYDS